MIRPPVLERASESSLQRVTEKGAAIAGLIHVGANDGAEIPWYKSRGARPILCFEPHPAALARAAEVWNGDPDVTFLGCALGSEEGSLTMLVPEDGDDEKTSRYRPIPTEGHEWTTVPVGTEITVPLVRFDEWARRTRVSMERYNTLVIDAQGMELEVLEGFGHQLQWITFLAVEVSRVPVYFGEPPAQAVIDWLGERGFAPLDEPKEHDDVVFVRSSMWRA